MTAQLFVPGRWATVWFGVLGSLLVERDGNPVDVGGARLRKLLAVLLVHTGDVVSEDRLLDAVWGAEVPRTGVRALRVNVSRLRKALTVGDQDRSRLETRPPGYVLHLEPEELDATVFERELARARGLLGEDDPLAAADVLGRALARWRGSALAEFSDEEWARPEAARLEELRVVATEERARARLACGLHDEVAGELTSLVERYPTREEPRSLAMVALYRSGRQADAIRVFQDYRRYLGDELGLEPSSELVELEAAILARDVSLLLPREQGRPLRGYRLLERIGEGRTSTVYRALQPGVEREVAVKVVGASEANRAEFVRDFHFEAQTAAGLEHPHVVPLHDHWRDADGAYLVMRLLRGGDVASRMAAGPSSPAVVARVVDEVGDALADMHRRGLVHANLSPGNVLFDEDGHAYLGDPLSLTGRTEPGEWWWPEGERPGPAADQYAVARMAQELLRGVPGNGTTIAPPLQAVLARALSDDPVERFPDVLTFVEAFVASTIQSETSSAQRSTDTVARRHPRNPYKGLRPFLETDADDFFGRDRLVAELVDRLDRPGLDGRFLAVVGPSGSGKSSVVRAGLVPAIRAGAMPRSGRWFVVTMLPGVDPFGELEASLLRIAVNPPDRLGPQLEEQGGVGRCIKRVLPDDGSELLVVIDQFEEVFTLVDDPSVRRRFLDGISDAVADRHARVRVVVTLRADFFDRPLRVPGFADLVEGHHVSITPMTGEELEQAVSGPSALQGVALQAGLVARIVADVAEHTAPLPLLQYAMAELFDHGTHDVLTVADYESIGGVTGALAGRAEGLHQSSSAAEQAATRLLFGRLVAPGEGAADTSRRTRRAELLAAGDDHVAMAEMIDRFGAARLLAFDRDPETREPTVELAHEALITRWPRLQGWIDEDRDGLRIVRHLTDTADAWDALDRDPGELYRGARLATATDWADAHPGTLTALEGDFLGESRRMAEVQQEEERARGRQAVRQNRRLRRSLTAVGVMLVIAVLAGVVAVSQRNEAARQRDQAEAGALAGTAVATAGQDVAQALEAAVGSYRLRPGGAESAEALLTSLSAAGPAIRTVHLGDEPVATAVDPRGHLAAAADADGRVRVWDLRTAEPASPTMAIGGAIAALRLDADGQRIAVGHQSGTSEVWDITRAERVAGPFPARSAGVPADELALEPGGPGFFEGTVGVFADVWNLDDGSTTPLQESNILSAVRFAGPDLVWGTENGSVFRRDPRTLQVTSVYDGGDLGPAESRVLDLAADPSGRYLAVAHQGPRVTLLDPASGPSSLAGSGRRTVALAFSSDGATLAGVSADGVTRVWETAAPDRAPVEIPTAWLGTAGPGFGGVAFDDEGHVILVGDGGAQVFDLGLDPLISTTDRPFGEDTRVNGVRYDADGRLVAVTSSTDSIRGAGQIARWSPGTDAVPVPLTVPGVGLDVSPDGVTAVVASDQDRLVVVDLRDGSRRQVDVGSRFPFAAAFSPDGHRFAVALIDQNVRVTITLFSVPALEREVTYELDRAGVPADLAFDSGGELLAVALGARPIKVIDLVGGTVDSVLTDAAAVLFDVGGRTMFIGGTDGYISTRDMGAPDRRVRAIDSQGDKARDIGLSPDGGTLYVIDEDGGLRILDVASRRQIGPVLRPPRLEGRDETPAATSLDLSPDGTQLAVAYVDGRVVVWDVAPATWAAKACALATGAVGSRGCETTPAVDPAASPPPWPFDADGTIASAVLMTSSDLGSGWIEASEGARFDARVAASIPGCASGLDVAFETGEREATVATSRALYPPDQGAVTHYVVVFPDAAAARRMYGRLAEPAFREGCLYAYGERLAPGGQLPLYDGAADVGYVPFYGTPVEPPSVPPVGDESFALAHETSWSSVTQRHGPEIYYVGSFLVGRTVHVVEGFHRTQDGRVITTEDAFASTMELLADRAARVLSEVDEP